MQTKHVATALTVYGIETNTDRSIRFSDIVNVATALTVYGIETAVLLCVVFEIYSLLQQHLPFTVLKLCGLISTVPRHKLQQHLPFTVLKQSSTPASIQILPLGLQQHLPFTVLKPPHVYNIKCKF